MKKILTVVLAALFLFTGFGGLAHAKERKKFVFGYSIYVWWMPLAYMNFTKILEDESRKEGIEVELRLIGDYPTSIDLYTAGQLDGVSITDMDLLISPANSGVDSTIPVVGDFSNDNDGVVLMNAKGGCEDLKGRRYRIVLGSVSQYIFANLLERCGISERDVVLVNTSDTDIVTAFKEDSDPRKAVVTWNPQLMQVRSLPGATMVFGSSQTPGEIIDMLAVRTDTPETFKRALTAAWYKTMKKVLPGSPERENAIAYMAHASGPTVTVEDFKAQMATTAIFYSPQDAAAFTKSENLKLTMEKVRSFCFSLGLFGQGARSKDEVGIQFPDGTVMGDPHNVKFRFEAKYMDGQL